MQNTDKGRLHSKLSSVFMDNRSILGNFLRRFFVSREDIEDVVQETYLRAYVAEQRKHIEHPKAYLFRTAKNLALDKLARKSNQITDYLEDLGVSAVLDSIESATVLQEIEAKESFGAYCDAVAALPEKCRQVYLLRKVHGLSHKEIAQQMSLTVSSVEKYLRRGLLDCANYQAELQNQHSKTKGAKTSAGATAKISKQ